MGEALAAAGVGPLNFTAVAPPVVVRVSVGGGVTVALTLEVTVMVTAMSLVPVTKAVSAAIVVAVVAPAGVLKVILTLSSRMFFPAPPPPIRAKRTRVLGPTEPSAPIKSKDFSPRGVP